MTNSRRRDIVGHAAFAVIALAIAVVSCLRIPYQDPMQKVLWSALALAGFIELVGSISGRSILGHEWHVDNGCISLLAMFFIPFALVTIYTLIYCTITGDQLGVRTQSITTSAYILIDVLMATWLLTTYGVKALNLICASVILSYCLTFIVSGIQVGANNIVAELQKSGQKNLFESHDVGVAVVPLIMAQCYVGFIKRQSIREFIKESAPMLVGLFLVLVLCGKRSAYLSLVVGLLVAGLLYLGRRRFELFSKIICIMGLIVCFLYVAGIRTGVLDILSSGFDTLSDRYYVWKWFDQMYSISPFSLGRGFGFVHRYMIAGLGPGLVTVYNYLHNSILQIYIEAGCIGFIIWFSIYCLIMPWYAQRVGGSILSAFTVVSIAAMCAMFTFDNTLTYPVYQVSLMVSLGSVCLAGRHSVVQKGGTH